MFTVIRSVSLLWGHIKCRAQLIILEEEKEGADL